MTMATLSQVLIAFLLALSVCRVIFFSVYRPLCIDEKDNEEKSSYSWHKNIQKISFCGDLYR